MKITKQDLADSLAEKTGVSRNAAYRIITVLLDDIKSHFRKGWTIELRGFGTFFPLFRPKRAFKIPRSGETREMPATTIMKFKTSRQLFIPKESRKKD